jgi:hypothetical protein
MEVAVVFLLVTMLFQTSTASEAPDTTEKNWLFSLEAGLGMGWMSHTLDDGLSSEYFEVDTLRKSIDQDAAGYRLSFGRRLNDRFHLMVYGGGSYLFPGLFFDNHGPFTRPELLYDLSEKQVGIECRMNVLRLGVGYSRYSGTVTLTPDDRPGMEPGERWKGDLKPRGGIHVIAGLTPTGHTKVAFSMNLIWRSIPLAFPATPTGADPDVFHRSMLEAQFMLYYNAYLF